jgi:predicted GNAT superfamily acetyltransferase/ubiquinone/menaquinone biosynthesis C-methylase UbiE
MVGACYSESSPPVAGDIDIGSDRIVAREPYGSGARWYDALSGEWPVYRVGRTTAIDLLDLSPGDRVLDLGCGTGLNLPLLQRAVGPTGRVLGVDRSEDMLSVASRRIQRGGFASTSVLMTDAVSLDPRRVVEALGGLADAVIATYTLSIMADPREAWRRALTAARPDSRLAIVDMQDPTGLARLVTPLARAFAGLGGADLDAHPWALLGSTAVNVRGRAVRGGHIQVRVGDRAVTASNRPDLPEGVRLRPLTIADAEQLQPLNDAASPAVPITAAADLANLIGMSALAIGVERAGRLVGFVLAVPPGAAYPSENYRFFESRDVDHLYVDRIVIGEGERGRGLGALLYDAVFEAAREQGRAEVTCEVNLDPPNPGSMAFHRRLGFRELGSQPTKGGSVTVALLSATL